MQYTKCSRIAIRAQQALSLSIIWSVCWVCHQKLVAGTEVDPPNADWVPIGPRFSNSVLQALIVLIAKRPPPVNFPSLSDLKMFR